jgi:hypothetical protein
MRKTARTTRATLDNKGPYQSLRVEIPGLAVERRSKSPGPTANRRIPRRKSAATTRRAPLGLIEHQTVDADLRLLTAATVSLLPDQFPDKLAAILKFVVLDLAIPDTLVMSDPAVKLTGVND